jgi:hypothetical protein
MHKMAVGLAALLAVAFFGPAMAETQTEEIQDSEQPGSEIDIDIGRDGNTEIQREDGKPLLGFGASGTEEEAEEDIPLDPLDDPDNPTDIDPIDEELPGEGPESLSGPDDMDALPE